MRFRVYPEPAFQEIGSDGVDGGRTAGVPCQTARLVSLLLAFSAFSFGIALLSGALLPLAARWLGQEPLAFLKYSKYVGNVSMIPASLFAFQLLMRRKGGKQLLRISTCGGC